MMTKYLSKLTDITHGNGNPRYIGTVLFYIGFVIYVSIVGFGFGFLALFLPDKINFKLINSFNHFIKFWLSFTCGIKHDYRGLENLPDGPCVIVANHQSTWETLMLQIIHEPTATVLKKELLSIPGFGLGLKALLPIAIDRKQKSQAKQIIHEQGLDRIAKGMSILIFPEGTRINADQRAKFAPTGVKLAVEGKIPVVALAHNAGECWPKRGFLKRSGTIKLHVSNPIDTSSGDVKTINFQTQEWVYAKLEEFEKQD